MTQRVYLKPAEGRRVRMLGTAKLIPDAGDWLERDSYIRRRQRDGDLVEAVPPEPVAEPAGEPPAPAEPVAPTEPAAAAAPTVPSAPTNKRAARPGNGVEA